MNTIDKQFQVFDPNPSIKFALDLFLKAGISQFALIGRLAMWVYLEDEIEAEISKQGLNYNHLHIGGIGLREEGVTIDFIDRRLHGIDRLFRVAIEEASCEVNVGENSIPVVSLEHLIAMKIVSGEPKDDKDLKKLLSLDKADYKKTRRIVEKYLGPITAERLDVFAREAGLLPKRGPYIYRK